MAERLTLELATPTRMVVAAEVDEVVVPGSEGYFGVLPGHAPLLATLGTGELTYRVGRDEYHVALACGFAEDFDLTFDSRSKEEICDVIVKGAILDKRLNCASGVEHVKKPRGVALWIITRHEPPGSCS